MERKTELTEPQRPADDLFDLRAASRVAGTGSFSAAARALGVQTSTVTRAVQRVEQRLGTRLFRRSTHGLSATEAGRVYAAHAARWLAEEDAVRDRLRLARDAGRGTLRVTVPVFVAERVLPGVIESFLRAQPEATIDVHASDDFRDVVKDGFDLAIRLGPLADSALRCRRVARFARVLCAAPAFLDGRREPRRRPEARRLRHPRDLAALPCLIYGSGTAPAVWTLRRVSGESVRVAVHGPLRSNNLELLTVLAARGLGVARLPEWAVRGALRDGHLVEVLRPWRHERERDQGALFAVHPVDPGKDRLRRAFLAALDEVVRG
jgi:DNA-binding transcriptional LysR family regulator